ncbi:unnamed protein product [Moneuplotes crassus]|uniref:Uncharacterized protein n=1 Tax=Euplotes crassus TaxID=5936 RepID=A0AAD1UDR9_EUPCR|nr:unnamed protein product [Moneuplotes crassus]
MDSNSRNWEKARNNIFQAEYAMQTATDLASCILKNQSSASQQRMFPYMARPQSTQRPNPNEVEVFNINHEREDQMSVVTAFTEKYQALEDQIKVYDKAQKQLLEEVKDTKIFYNELVKIRQKYLIQDALLLKEFKQKSQKVKKMMKGSGTLYCHIIKAPNLYYPKKQMNYYDKVLLVRGKEGKLEYRCHPSLRKSFRLKTELVYEMKDFHKQKQTLIWSINGDNITENSGKNPSFIPNIVQKLKLLSLYRCLAKEATGLAYYANKEPEYHVLGGKGESHQGQKGGRNSDLCEESSKINQYEFIKNIQISCKEAEDGYREMKIRVELCCDVYIECNFSIEQYAFQTDEAKETKEESHEKDEEEDLVVKPTVFYQILETCICRENIDDIISLDLMAYLTQKYTNYIMNKIMNPDLCLHYEFLYSEQNYFKYHINLYSKNKDSDTNLTKRTTIIILEVENFKLVLNEKSKTTNDSEYLGTFTTTEVKNLVEELSSALSTHLC